MIQGLLHVLTLAWKPILLVFSAVAVYLKGRTDAELGSRRAADKARRRADDAASKYRADDVTDRLRRGDF